ncbi:unnamed protein product [Pelagomonas calceolata]|uniref:H(+)-exporting diphosphatase n=2 Tax=Pelagomonas calceolata TaxID=35677 RepID=A0A8J2SS17_9STRA|nr:unnamed protein product [Pelagomonas calceolata]
MAPFARNDKTVLEIALPALVGGVLALAFTTYTFFSLKGEPTGKDVGRPLVDKYGAMIKEGAMAFLKEEYKWLSVFVVLLGGILCALFSVEDQHTKLDGVLTTFAFFLGAILSASAGWLGMMVATDGNTRTTAACAGKEVKDAQGKVTGGTGSLNDGLRVAFKAGSVMGFVVVGLGLVGCAGCFCVLAIHNGLGKTESLQILAGFGFGASSIALFARVAGGIYTKAADVGADLVGKVEAGIDEDDPHNPAVIADNVGDNVGDVAGMGADLFESYVGSIIAAATLAKRDNEIALPFWLSACGVVAAMIGTMAVSTNEKGEGWNSNLGALMWALEKGTMLAGVLFLGLAAACCHLLGGMWGAYICVLIGLACGMVIGKITEYFTSFDFAPVKSIKARGATGPATVTIQGLGVGMISCVPTIVVLVCAILGCAAIKGEYGVAIAAVGMLATLGITLATDAYGPVADNAGGLAEMDPAIPDEVRCITDSLDALGNTTAATGKGFAIGSAVLTSLSLLAAFKEQAQLDVSLLAVTDPYVLSGMLFGPRRRPNSAQISTRDHPSPPLPETIHEDGVASRFEPRRRHAALHVRGPHDDLRRQGRRRDHHGGPRPIPQPPRPRRPGRQDHPQGLYYYGVERRADSSPHGRHSRQQQMCGYQYQVVGAGDDRARRLRDPRALVRGLLGRSPLLGGYVGRWHWKWCHGRDNDEQRRRRLGQREEVLREGRHEGPVQGQERRRKLSSSDEEDVVRRVCGGRHGRRPLQGHVGAGPEHPHQVDEHGQSHDCSFTEDVRQALGVLLLGLPAARFVRGLDGGAGLHRNINVGGPHRQDARRGREKS